MSNSVMRSPRGFMSPPGGGGSDVSPQEVENLATWIKGCFERAAVTHFELKQRSGNEMAAGKIAEWFREDFENKDPAQLSEVVMNEAHKDAESQRGTTRYVVFAFKEGDANNFA